jgi:hypothetical protein
VKFPFQLNRYTRTGALGAVIYQIGGLYEAKIKRGRTQMRQMDIVLKRTE